MSAVDHTSVVSAIVTHVASFKHVASGAMPFSYYALRSAKQVRHGRDSHAEPPPKTISMREEFTSMRCSVAGIAPIVLMALCAGVASAQNYPDKPIRVLTTTTGGPNDLASRLIADGVAAGSQRASVQLWNRGHPGYARGICGHDQIRDEPDGQSHQGVAAAGIVPVTSIRQYCSGCMFISDNP